MLFRCMVTAMRQSKCLYVSYPFGDELRQILPKTARQDVGRYPKESPVEATRIRVLLFELLVV